MVFHCWNVLAPLLLGMIFVLHGMTVVAGADRIVPGLVQERPAEGRFVELKTGYMVPYRVTIPGSEVTFDMVPIPGGEFLMGSPATEPGRQPPEGPQVLVRVEPFWMAKCEVSWAEYQQFMELDQIFRKFIAAGIRPVTEANRVDAVTAPTELYEPAFSFVHGDDPRQAAVTMTQFAARQYSKWMSGLTGQQYRLPSEAEWEYACRAGTTTRWSFGDDPAQLGEYAWYRGNCEDPGQRPVGTRRPNPWGLHDLHGNVAEWVLDKYSDDGLTRLVGKRDLTALETVLWPDVLWPRMVKGGSWQDDANGCRSVSKFGSNDPEWKQNDPDRPMSPYWFTDDPARGVGFRLLRPLKEVSREEMHRFWEIDCEDLRIDMQYKSEDGRAKLGIVDPDLPKVIQALKLQRQSRP